MRRLLLTSFIWQNPEISFEQAKNNISNKIMITKFMINRVNNYDKLVEQKIGKNKTKSYKNISKFGKPNKNLNFTVEKVFDHVLCNVFKSGFLDVPSVKNLCNTHKLYEHYYLLLHKCIDIDFSKLWDKNPNWNSQTEISFQKRMQFLSCAFYVDLNIPFMICYLGG